MPHTAATTHLDPQANADVRPVRGDGSGRWRSRPTESVTRTSSGLRHGLRKSRPRNSTDTRAASASQARPAATITTVREDRHLSWSGCWNARDLGGRPTVSGRATRWAAVVRADALDG